MKFNNLKKVGIALTLGGFLSISTIGASQLVYADNDSNIYGGQEVVNGMLRTGIDSGKVDGGTWVRGKSGNKVVSKYVHYKKDGHASTVNGVGTVDDGGWKPKDEWSIANKNIWTKTGINHAYYNHR